MKRLIDCKLIFFCVKAYLLVYFKRKILSDRSPFVISDIYQRRSRRGRESRASGEPLPLRAGMGAQIKQD